MTFRRVARIQMAMSTLGGVGVSHLTSSWLAAPISSFGMVLPT